MYAQVITDFQLPRDKLKAIASKFIAEMTKGLSEHNQTLKMIPSYVTNLPTGNETSTYLALDLGGTNFRVCSVTLLGNSKFSLTHSKFTIPDNMKTGKGEELFDFIADCIYTFIHEHATEESGMKHMKDGSLKLGFTFSFPVNQTALDKGTLIHWSKGFTASNVVDNDVVELLQKSLHKKNLNITVSALVNDTVGTLMAHAYPSPSTRVGVIFGTGTNAAYVSPSSAITKYKGPAPSSKQMIINIEWGAFDNEKQVLPLTKYDEQLDKDSSNPGAQIFEKLISGMYLGEIVRYTVVDLIANGALFGGKMTKEWEKAHAFQTAYMSAIEADTSPALTSTSQILTTHFSMPNTTLTDRQLLKSLVQQIGTRAARLSGIAIYSVLEKLGLPLSSTHYNPNPSESERKSPEEGGPVTVAIDGSVWLHYPGFQDRVKSVLREMMGAEKAEMVKLENAEDGSGVGAALIAALAE
ncbi:hypothetical protein BKA69DRAFT_1078924 [Paraphysoderma sedebokerense]|nr:hypothetical protein BKA69DRAFT_1078924 [Paraphysoderma sedebokerense]